MNSSVKSNRIIVVVGFLLVGFCTSCNSGRDKSDPYYGPDDFPKVKKTDVHAHINTLDPAVTEQAKKDNVLLISINVEVPDEPPVDSQMYYGLQQHRRSPEAIYYVSTFETSTINEPGWNDAQLAWLKKTFDSAAIGIKVWKNIGMTVKDKDSNFIMIDNPIFDPIFNYLEQHNIPVIGHLGEPKNCWLPLEQMTTNNDRNYFREHPEYHMYLHPEYPSYETIIAARDNLLNKHPNLQFIGAHMASLEWDVDEIAKRLDKYPNMMVETAARFGQIQFQTITGWQKVHDFFITYQDRILYGTDIVVSAGDHAEQAAMNAHNVWLRDWQYLTSADSLETPFLNRKIKGLHLPKAVINKIYAENAARMFSLKP